jgi:uncharacterized protein (DUF1810 family)
MSTIGHDAFNLKRFIKAQAPIFGSALAELKAGKKQGHWMWFVFPQLRGLGHSSTADYYGISSLAEAEAYLNHAHLGPRLMTCTEAVLASDAPSLKSLFGSPDDLKFCSSMTLFATLLDSDGNVFHRALERWCDGQRDEKTLRLLLD